MTLQKKKTERNNPPRLPPTTAEMSGVTYYRRYLCLSTEKNFAVVFLKL